MVLPAGVEPALFPGCKPGALATELWEHGVKIGGLNGIRTRNTLRCKRSAFPNKLPARENGASSRTRTRFSGVQNLSFTI